MNTNRHHNSTNSAVQYAPPLWTAGLSLNRINDLAISCLGNGSSGKRSHGSRCLGRNPKPHRRSHHWGWLPAYPEGRKPFTRPLVIVDLIFTIITFGPHPPVLDIHRYGTVNRRIP